MQRWRGDAGSEANTQKMEFSWTSCSFFVRRTLGVFVPLHQYYLASHSGRGWETWLLAACLTCNISLPAGGRCPDGPRVSALSGFTSTCVCAGLLRLEHPCNELLCSVGCLFISGLLIGVSIYWWLKDTLLCEAAFRRAPLVCIPEAADKCCRSSGQV